MRSTASARAEAAHAASSGRNGEDLAIRFVNTAAWRLREPSEERLPDADALLAWVGRNGIGDAGRMKGTPVRRADAKARQIAYQAAIGLREAIYQILIARIKGDAPPDAALKLFNQLLASATSGAEVAWRAGALMWGVQSHSGGFDFLKPIIISAAALMTGPRAGQLKQCQDDRGCGWLFVDESRAQNRRWCAMGDCGNRAKARRHYDRVRRNVARMGAG